MAGNATRIAENRPGEGIQQEAAAAAAAGVQRYEEGNSSQAERPLQEEPAA